MDKTADEGLATLASYLRRISATRHLWSRRRAALIQGEATRSGRWVSALRN
jgi:hypothetical protein